MRKRRVPGAWSFRSLRLVTAIAVLVLAAGEGATDPILRVTPARDQVQLGEAFAVGIIPDPATGGLGGATVTQVQFLPVGEVWHIAEDWRQPMGAAVPDERWLWMARLQAFEPGAQPMPKVQAVLRHPDGTTEVIDLAGPELTVVDGLDDSTAELRDLRSIHPYRFDRRLLAAMIAGGFLAGIGALLLARRLYQAYATRGEAPPPPLAPVPWALQELDRRRELPECRAGNSKAIATEVSDVIRRYLQRQYGFPAMEMTTHECVARLRRTYVPAGLTAKVQDFLGECDTVKFTRIDFDAARRDSVWESAREIVMLSHRAEESAADPLKGTREQAMEAPG